MIPSFANSFLSTAEYVDFIIGELKAGATGVTLTYANENGWSAETVTRTTWTAASGFERSSKVFQGVAEVLEHAPQYDKTETHVSEVVIRKELSSRRQHSGFRDLLGQSICRDVAAATAACNRPEARAHARRLLGQWSTDLKTPLDVVVADVKLGALDEARALASETLAQLLANIKMERRGAEVFRLGMSDKDQGQAVIRTEAWLAALSILFPESGEFVYWRAATLELLNRHAEALVEYTKARKLGKPKDFHTEVRPKDLDPAAGRKALQVLKAKWLKKE
jgi:hypothetical protein